MSKKLKKIVCVGGGTGTFTVLSGLKKHPVDLTAIVSMADNGGSNRIIRDEFGLLPTSDLRQCFVALADDKNNSGQILRELFTYRFYRGNGLNGMTFGNLFMLALTDIFGSQIKAIEATHQVLKINGNILPVTLTNSNLVAIYENGKKVVGEHLIDEPEHDGKLKIKKVYLIPEANAYPKAIQAIQEADLIIIGPGDLYTSLIANFLVKGIANAICTVKAKKVYIMNLMTKYGQTYNFTARDHIKILENYIGKKCFDFVLFNSGKIPDIILKKYNEKNEIPVKDDLKNTYFKVIKRDVLNKEEKKKVSGDNLKRSLIRHDPQKLAKIILNLCK